MTLTQHPRSWFLKDIDYANLSGPGEVAILPTYLRFYGGRTP